MPNKDKNQELAQQLKAEFKKGNFQPSQIKRSKSLSDISKSPVAPNQGLITLRAENKDLRIQLSATNNQLIDQNNELRLQALKNADWIKEHDKEMEQAVKEFNQLEDQKTNYQVQNGILLKEKSQLAQQLKSAQDRIERLYKLKGLPTTNSEAPTINWTNLLITGTLIYGVSYLIWPTHHQQK